MRLACLLLTCTVCLHAASWNIVVDPAEDLVLHTAAEELQGLLSAAYPDDSFRCVADLPDAGAAILLGTRTEGSLIAEWVQPEQVAADGAFVAGVGSHQGRSVAYVCGQDAGATLRGMYQVLDRQYDFGFAMSFEASEAVRPGPFDLEPWQLADQPRIPERFLFAWFNYLEVNGTWSLADWRQALRNGASLGFNQVFFHCYANDPLLEFTHNGQTKRVGWRNSSRKGRTYAVEHLWDVRRQVGGALYDGPVFGSEGAAVLPDGSDTVPDAERVQAARALMVEVMAMAKAYGYHVIWGIDIDTRPAWDRAFITKAVPEEARFSAGGRWQKFQLVDPTVAAGRDFFRSMLQTYLREMPGVDTYMLWVRQSSQTPVLGMTFEAMPAAWQQDLRRQLPEGSPADSKQSPGIYYVNKVAECWRSILDEAGHADKGVGFGSWSWQLSEKFLPANVLMAPEMSFLVVDYGNAFGNSPGFDEVMRTVAEKRVVGALMRNKNDDGGYFGKPMPPQQNISQALADTGMQRLGTYSYMPRPSDLYTLSVARQLWSGSQAADLDSVIRDAARDWFGAAAAPAMQAYLQNWMDRSPLVGRTSGNHFMEDLKQKWYEQAVQNGPQRIALLETVDQGTLSPAAQARWRYWRQLEEFMLRFHEAHWRFQKKDKGSLASDDAEQAIASLAQAFGSHDVNPGEKGLIVDLHTRWLSFIVAERQALGLDAIRVRFLPTNHDPLARKAGERTFAMDHEQRLWCVLGENETAVPVVVRQPYADDTTTEICGAWLQSEKAIELTIGNVRNEHRLGSGSYRVRLLAPGGADRGVQQVSLQGSDRGAWDLAAAGAVAEFVVEDVAISDGALQMRIQAEQGPTVLSGVILEPIGTITPPQADGKRSDNRER